MHTIVPAVVPLWVLVSAAIKHLNAVLVASHLLIAFTQLHKHCQIAANIFMVTILHTHTINV